MLSTSAFQPREGGRALPVVVEGWMLQSGMYSEISKGGTYEFTLCVTIQGAARGDSLNQPAGEIGWQWTGIGSLVDACAQVVDTLTAANGKQLTILDFAAPAFTTDRVQTMGQPAKAGDRVRLCLDVGIDELIFASFPHDPHRRPDLRRSWQVVNVEIDRSTVTVEQPGRGPATQAYEEATSPWFPSADNQWTSIDRTRSQTDSPRGSAMYRLWLLPTGREASGAW